MTERGRYIAHLLCVWALCVGALFGAASAPPENVHTGRAISAVLQGGPREARYIGRGAIYRAFYIGLPHNVRLHMARIAWCESGRDHSAGVRSTESHRGFYKFDAPTWASVGGQGDPARASWYEQTYRAVLLMWRRGYEPWRASARCSGLR